MRKIIATLSVLTLLLAGCAPASNDDTIIVGLECNYAPFNWTQIESESPAVKIEGDAAYCDGYDIAIAQAIADGLDKTLIVKKIAWEGLEPALNSNEIDMIVAGMTDTAERRESVSFSSPYYASDMVLIVRKDSLYASAKSLADFSGAKVIAQLSTFHDDIVDQIPSVVHMTPLSSFPLLVNSVSTKDADAMVSERPVAISIVATNSDLVIVSFDEGSGFATSFEDTTVSVAVRKADTDLLASINMILAGISDDTRNQWMTDALARQPEGN
jgi:ABC-type amino acid transport substrate-binding protein